MAQLDGRNLAEGSQGPRSTQPRGGGWIQTLLLDSALSRVHAFCCASASIQGSPPICVSATEEIQLPVMDVRAEEIAQAN